MPARPKLIVPIRVYAIHQAQEGAVSGPEMDFESLPYYDKKRQQDVNPDVPYLAESIIPRPFQDANFILKAGVHLSWDLPQFLKRTAFRASDPTGFPAVPTRWLVSRYAARKRNPDRQWVVESDALLSGEGGATIYDMAQTSVDVDIYSGEQPFAYIGHSDTLAAWQQRRGRLCGRQRRGGERRRRGQRGQRGRGGRDGGGNLLRPRGLGGRRCGLRAGRAARPEQAEQREQGQGERSADIALCGHESLAPV